MICFIELIFTHHTLFRKLSRCVNRVTTGYRLAEPARAADALQAQITAAERSFIKEIARFNGRGRRTGPVRPATEEEKILDLSG